MKLRGTFVALAALFEEKQQEAFCFLRHVRIALRCNGRHVFLTSRVQRIAIWNVSHAGASIMHNRSRRPGSIAISRKSRSGSKKFLFGVGLRKLRRF